MTTTWLLAATIAVAGANAGDGAVTRAPASSPGPGTDHADAIAQVRRSVVTLVARSSAAQVLERLARELGPQVSLHFSAAAREAGQQRVASGIVIDGDGFLVTSASFAIHGGPFGVRLPGGEERPADLIGIDLATDVALFRSAAQGLVAARLLDAPPPPASGSTLCVVGSLSPSRCAHAEGRLDRAEINPGAGRLHDYLALDSTAPPGSAGAAVVDVRGRVVGMVSALRQGGGTFAVPAATVTEVARTLRREGSIRRGWLGLNVVSLPEQAGPARGIAVAGVVPGSPAARAGLAADDLVVGYDGKPVGAIADFVRRVAQGKPGERVQIRFLRDGRESSATAVLTERPEPERVGGIRVRLAADHRGWLGVNTQPLTEPLRRQFGARAGEDQGGVLLSEVVPDSPAAAAGLAAGDIVLRIADQPVATTDAFTAAVRSRNPGDRVSFDVVRGGQRSTISATLGRRPVDTWLGQIPQFHLAFGPEQWQAITTALEALPDKQRDRGIEDVRTLLEQASPSAASRRQLEELRRELERLSHPTVR